MNEKDAAQPKTIHADVSNPEEPQPETMEVVEVWFWEAKNERWERFTTVESNRNEKNVDEIEVQEAVRSLWPIKEIRIIRFTLKPEEESP